MSYEYVKRARKRRKKLVVDALGGKCCKCEYSGCIEALDFHHKDPSEKDFAIASSWNNFAIALEEARKCVLLCSNCHREFHAGLWLLDEITIPDFNESVIDEYLLSKKGSTYDRECKGCGKHFTTKHSHKMYCTTSCHAARRRKGWPPKETLEKLVWEKPSTEIAIEYGVSDRAVGKWCKAYSIDKPPRGYWSGK